MLGPICQYKPMPPTKLQRARRHEWKPIQYCGLLEGEEMPHPDAQWFRASKQLEMAVRAGAQEAQVYVSTYKVWKYLYVKGCVEQDGFAIYKHCRGQHANLYFSYISTKIVDLQAVGIEADGKWKCSIVSSLSGDVITEVILTPAKTISFATQQIEEHMREHRFLTQQNFLEIRTFDGFNPQCKVKTTSLKPSIEACAKRMKLTN